MKNSTQFNTASSDEDYESRSSAGAHFWYNVRTPLLASVFVAPMFVWPLFLDPAVTPTTAALDPGSTAQACVEWENASLDALNKRMDGPEVGREAFERSANRWLAEARRNCSSGSPARAARSYQKIIATAKTEMASAR
ncbi:hypothetical protein [Flaviflagellibacter deserti]|jgi:hypothetical protein|uniref:DUF1311 domain-containing protein n=1 Tax=Flaviflagellibacter deserti TaxID=2267266 RepID=A0ABV9Z0F1_9HYPH